jgi:hypothetical protein
LLPALPAQNTIRKTVDGGCQISLYDGPPVSENAIAVQTARLKAAFPKMEKLFFDILAERIVENDFTEKRLKDAVNSVIDNFRYKELTVSDIIGFDRRVKLYTGNEFVNAQMRGIHCSEFEMREIEGIKFWILREDLIKAGWN